MSHRDLLPTEQSPRGATSVDGQATSAVSSVETVKESGGSCWQQTVPYFRARITEDEIREVSECLRSGWLTSGPRVREFEKQFATAVEAKHAVAVNSCTAALHLAVEALGLTAGQAVLVPTMTFAATAEVVRYQGAEPILVDCDPVTLHIDLADAERKLADLRRRRLPLAADLQVVGIMPVHVGGMMMDMDALERFAECHDLWVVEDAAHAFPAAYRRDANAPWRRCGQDTAAVTCYSFYANKTITTGEGGMAVTADPRLAERMRQMSLHGLSRDAWSRFQSKGSWDYRIVAPGYKYNLTDIAAALGLRQLERADGMRREREGIAEFYTRQLGDLEAIELPPAAVDRIHSWHLYPIRIRQAKLSIDRNTFIDQLRERGVGTSVHWRPLHLHPYYAEQCQWSATQLPVATAEWERLVSLPIFPGMEDTEAEYVVAAVRDVCQRHASRGNGEAPASCVAAVAHEAAVGSRPAEASESEPPLTRIAPTRWLNAVCKRIFDVTASTLGLLLVSPVMLLAAICVACDSPGGVLFRQQRVGRGFRRFEMLKFRTMVQDSQARGPALTVGNDERVTRVGRVLRKTKIDELPQLINVIRGEMSLVGPRPEVPQYVEMFRADYREILAVRPGITDIASIRYRDEARVLASAEDPEEEYVRRILPEKISLAKEYVRRSSVALDIALIVGTLLNLSGIVTSGSIRSS